MNILFSVINKLGVFGKKVKITFYGFIFVLLSIGLDVLIVQLLGDNSRLLPRGSQFIILFFSITFVYLLLVSLLHLIYPVKCSVCGWRGRQFNDNDCGYGHIYKNSTCPGCLSQPRQRAFIFYFKKIAPKNKSLKLLHFAPENFVTKFLQSYKNIDYLSVDIDPTKAMQREDITRLSFADSSFDIIICSHVLEHILDDTKAMRELLRILKPGGFAVIDVPIDYSRAETYEDLTITSPEGRTEAFWQFDHLRLYGRDFPDKLQQVGFKVIIDEFIFSLSQKKKNHFGLIDTPIYLCKKEGD